MPDGVTSITSTELRLLRGRHRCELRRFHRQLTCFAWGPHRQGTGSDLNDAENPKGHRADLAHPYI